MANDRRDRFGSSDGALPGFAWSGRAEDLLRAGITVHDVHREGQELAKLTRHGTPAVRSRLPSDKKK